MRPPELAAELDLPLRSPEVELAGPYRDMAYQDGRWLLCIGGNRYLQATELLYRVLQHADGATDLAGIAGSVSTESGQEVTPADVGWLLENRLRPAGLVLAAGSPGAPAGAPLMKSLKPKTQTLGIRYRLPLLPYRLTRPAADVLKHLYAVPVVIAVLAAALYVNVAMYSSSDLLKALSSLFYTPETVLVLFAMENVASLWHELGHAAALRRGGVRYGWIGVALYIIFPVYFTDVSHSYRLSRWRRVRVDLGGMYFDLISMLVSYALYLWTGYLPLLLFVGILGLGLLGQFTPFMRFDGYYLIADLVGVPEPLSALGPWLKGVLRRGEGEPRLILNRRAQWMMAAYAALVVGFFTRPVLIMGVAGGAIVTQLPLSAAAVWNAFKVAWGSGGAVAKASATVEIVFWLLIPLGLLLFAWGLLRLLAAGLLAGGRALVHRLRQPEVPALGPAGTEPR